VTGIDPIRPGGLHDQHEKGAARADIDPAAVMAAHEKHVSGPTVATPCAKLPERRWDEAHEHCEPYRLAEALAAERAKVARVVKFRDGWRTDADADERWLNGPRVSVSEAHEYPALIQQARSHADDIDAALADQPEQVSP
jgi:hypothetical protein